MTQTISSDEQMVAEVVGAFEREIGVTNVPVEVKQAGDRTFIKFTVGREAPLYTYALLRTQQTLSANNPFRGAVALKIAPSRKEFPNSLEAGALLTLLTRSTREVSQSNFDQGFKVPYIPFHNREDHQLAQAASHVVRGRRGVGKSTLIGRAVEILRSKSSLIKVLDMQAYSTLTDEELLIEVLSDVARGFAETGNTESHAELVDEI